MLSHLVYISRSLKPVTPELIKALSEKNTQNNMTKGVTGMLIFGNGWFMELLEGDVYAVIELFDEIAQDTRHTDVTQLFLGPASKRYFGDWNVGVVNFEPAPPGDKSRLAAMTELASIDQRGAPRVDAITLLKRFMSTLSAPKKADTKAA
ncbi:MAG: hypothetical protein C0475_02985 [Planctomyces sp.]|nr:hypothetical protein [Planctomyces sp.]MBA4038868.1 hypothetical protein [Planctomyces sp.]MBA4119736.1 hypothetical protein [Isosphaera sp.]